MAGERRDSSKADKRWQAYEMAITLLDHDTQNQWALFATFFVPQAVLLGLALQSLSPDPTKVVYLSGSIQPAFAVGVFGLLLCVPTLITHARSNFIARLRIREVLELEKDFKPPLLFHEGRDLVEGKEVRGLKLYWYMRRRWNNTFYLRALVVLWAIADASVAATHLPTGVVGDIGAVTVIGLLAINSYLVRGWFNKPKAHL